MLRAFVDGLKRGMTQTDAARAADYKNPAKIACKLIRYPLVVATMADHAEIQRKAEEKAADGQAKKTAVSRATVTERLWTLATMGPKETNGTINGQVRAAAVLVEVLGMKIGAQNPDKFDGFTDSELEQYAKDGTVPERFASRFGITPGSPTQVM